MEPIVAGGGGATGDGGESRRGCLASARGRRRWCNGEAAVASTGLGNGRERERES